MYTFILKKKRIFLLFSPSTLFLCYIFSYRNFSHLLRLIIMVISEAATKHIWDFISSTTFLIMNVKIPFSNLFSNYIQKYWSYLLWYSCNDAALQYVWSWYVKPGECPHTPSLLGVGYATIASRSQACLDVWHNPVPSHPQAERIWCRSAQSCLGSNNMPLLSSYQEGKYLQGEKVLLFSWHSVYFFSLLNSLDSYVLFFMNVLLGLAWSINTSVGLCSSASAHVSSPPLHSWDLLIYYFISFKFSPLSVWYFYHALSYIFNEPWCAQ